MDGEMTEARLTEIEARARMVASADVDVSARLLADDDVPALVAEVRRLRAEAVTPQGETWRSRCLAMQAEYEEVLREMDALRAIVDGRTTPPTTREARYHSHVTRGAFVVMIGDDRAHVGARVVTGLGKLPREPSRWWALDRDGRPCAWPVPATTEGA